MKNNDDDDGWSDVESNDGWSDVESTPTPTVELYTYSIRKKDGGRLGEVSATSEADAMDQAEGMGFTRGTYNVVRKYDKPTDVKGSEELLIKRGMNPKEASTMAKVMPYASSDVYDKPLSEVELMSGASQRDVFSLPGRFLASRLGGTNEGEDQWTSMGRTSEDEGTNFGGSIVRSPATGVATLLAPLATLGVGALGVSSPWLVGALEGGLVGGGTSAFNYATDEDYTLADAAIETLLSAGIGSLIKGGSAKSIAKAKEMIKSAGDFTQNQIDYIYSKLGITSGGTKTNLQTEASERIGDIANIEYGGLFNPETGKRSEYVSDALGVNIPKDVASKYEQSINMGMLHRNLNPAQAKDKRAILAEFNEWASELQKIDPSQSIKYLDGLLEDAKYFYQKDPELGQLMLNKIEELYKLNYQLMDNQGAVALAPMKDLTSGFGKISASTRYTANPPKPVKVFESGGVGGVGTLAPDITPERAKLVGSTLQALRMPSIIATQDVTAPDYLNLNQMRSK